jgi:hypothetical protein
VPLKSSAMPSIAARKRTSHEVADGPERDISLTDQRDSSAGAFTRLEQQPHARSAKDDVRNFVQFHTAWALLAHGPKTKRVPV